MVVEQQIEKESFRKAKKGKARSKQFGRVEIPQEVFIGKVKISKEKINENI